MTNIDPDYVAVSDLADQAAHAIRVLNHRTRPGIGDVTDPSEVAEIIAALASMTSMLPQLLDQLAGWHEHQHSNGRLTVDALAPLPDTAQSVHVLIDSLHHAIQRLQRAAVDLDTAHEHAAHLATARTDAPGPTFVQISAAKSLDETHSSRSRVYSRSEAAGLEQ